MLASLNLFHDIVKSVVVRLVKFCMQYVLEGPGTKGKKVKVLHQSQNFIVIDKDYDVVINSNDPSKVSVEKYLCREFPSLVNPKLKHNFYFVHRLDYATSGVICVALNKEASSAASSAFEKRHAKKYYLALLRGHVSCEVLDVFAPIGEEANEINKSNRMCVENNSKALCVSPRKAHTRLLTLERGLYDNYPATKVLLHPITGRRHQLRVHCAYLGHTVVGDFTYSYRKDVEPFRTFLHSYRLILPNSIEGLDISSGDPFSPSDQRNKWRPIETLNSLTDNDIFGKLSTETNLISKM